MSKQKHPGGRPPKWSDPVALESMIDQYFRECFLVEDTRVFAHGEQFEWLNEDTSKTELRCKECRGLIYDRYVLPTQGCIVLSGRLKERISPTISGLCAHLDCDKETLREYREKDQFSAPINKAYLLCEREHELELHKDNVPPAKTIFALSNFGWKNPQKIQLSGDPENTTPIAISSADKAIADIDASRKA